MTSTDGTTVAEAPADRKPLRLWPGILIVTLQWLGRFVVPVVAPDAMIFGVLGGLLGSVLVLIWWLFLSRAPWVERIGALAVIAVAMVVTPFLLHPSVATGNMGLMFPIFVLPLLSLVLVAWAVLSRRLGSSAARWTALVAGVVVACGVWTMVRTGGNTTDFEHDFALRWTKTPEEILLAQEDGATLDAAPLAIEAVDPQWPGFRGAERDSVIRGTRLATDWAASPPTEVWRRAIGPGWSSFAVLGDLVFTQEQRGEVEVVSSYRLSTGEPVWRHEDTARFWESVGGAGPRGTPTLYDGRVYTLGATGLVNVLDAADGSVYWSQDAAADTETETPTWGYSGSPLVTDDLVIVAASGRLVAYGRESGDLRWLGPSAGEGYSSPHLLNLDGVEQVVLIHGDGVVAVEPSDGAVLWQHEWSGYPIVQPGVTADGDLLISVTDRSGLRRLAVEAADSGWTVEERWTSIGLKPYFNDFVVHKGHAYGFDGTILASIDLIDGERQWKGGRYGGGQLVLLADQDLLLVLSEKGELALVSATPDQFTELARFPAIEGKTWNHPVLVGDLLLVRNDQEMAAFRMPTEG